jgi:predicted DNA-binding transcriptional regulator AlpA
MTAPQSELRLVDVAQLLGVSKQRAHQLARERGFPAPVAEDYRGRMWDRHEVTA